MYNNPLYLNRTSLDLVNLPIDGNIVFHQGEILQGVVKDINQDGMVALAVKGRVIEAAAQVPVTIGETLLMVVDQVKTGQVRLKVMSPVEMQQGEDQAIAERLMEMGISPRPSHVHMARQLLNNDLILNLNNLEAIIKSTAQLGEATPQNINLAVFQLVRNLPQDSTILKALAQYTSPGSNINTLLGDVLAALEAFEPAEPAARQSQIPPVPTALGNAPHDVEQQSGIINSPEAKAATKTTTEQGLNPVLPKIAAADDFLKQLSLLLRSELTTHRLHAQDSPRQAAQRLEQVLRSGPDLLRGLLLLQEAVEGSANPAYDRPSINISNKLEALSREMLGQNIMNLYTRPSDEAPQYYFAFPVQWGEQSQLCQLRISAKPGKSGLKDREQINLAVSLETPRLGMVLFHLTWHRLKQLELRGVVSSQTSYNRLHPYLHELKRSLQELGYSVTDHGLKISPAEENQSLKVLPESQARPGQSGWFKVDIKV